MVGLGAFVTTLCQPKVIGRLPFQLLLKEQVHLDPNAQALFWLWATFAWNIKPIAGVFSDAFPLFGTRRRHYLILSSVIAAISWIALALVPKTYAPLLIAACMANTFLVIGSTVMGGLMVEAGQKFGASGRITSLRNLVQSVVSLGNGVLGGYLATKAFGWTAGIAAGFLIALVTTSVLVLKEPVGAKKRTEVLQNAKQQLIAILRSPTLWMAGIFLALVYISPGFSTPLLYWQKDLLKFDTPFIGFLETVEGATGIVGSVLYLALCRRVQLRALLPISIALHAAGTLLFLFYSKSSAIPIHAVYGFVVVCSELALMDLAVRATPRGCEALGFSLMMSARNFAGQGSDNIGSYLSVHHWTFTKLVYLNSATSALVLILIPLLPRVIMSSRDGESR
jgi:predicted MFS family arabinose efflux permease